MCKVNPVPYVRAMMSGADCRALRFEYVCGLLLAISTRTSAQKMLVGVRFFPRRPLAARSNNPYPDDFPNTAQGSVEYEKGRAGQVFDKASQTYSKF